MLAGRAHGGSPRRGKKAEQEPPGPTLPAAGPSEGGGSQVRAAPDALQVILALSKGALLPGRGRKMSECFDFAGLARYLLAF